MSQSSNFNLEAELPQEERKRYDELFKEKNMDNIILKDTALELFRQESQLPAEVLNEVWQKADKENKGFLVEKEFKNALARLYQWSLQHNTFKQQHTASPLLSGPGVLIHSSPVQTVSPSFGNVITLEDGAKYLAWFERLDKDKNGHIDGSDAIHFFRQSNLKNEVLAFIWDKADTRQRGKLDQVEFVIAMVYITHAMRYADQINNGQMSLTDTRFPSSEQVIASARSTMTALTQPQLFASTPASPVTQHLTGTSVANRDGIPVEDAAERLKQSGLSEKILEEIWNIAVKDKSESNNFIKSEEFSHAMQLVQNFMARNPLLAGSPNPARPPPPAFDLLGDFTNTNTNTNTKEQGQELVPHQSGASGTAQSQLWNQYNTEQQGVQSLRENVSKEKETLAGYRREAENLEEVVKALLSEKDKLQRELQTYRQETKHFKERIQNARLEESAVKGEIEIMEKEKQAMQSQLSQQSQHSFPMTSKPEGSLFSLSQSPSDLLSKPFGNGSAESPIRSLGPTSLETLKQKRDKSPATPPSIHDIEDKFPDLSTVEQEFAIPNNSAQSDFKKTNSQSNSITSSPFTASTTLPQAPPIKSPSEPETQTSKPNKYGFDISQFELPFEVPSNEPKDQPIRGDTAFSPFTTTPASTTTTTIAPANPQLSFDDAFLTLLSTENRQPSSQPQQQPQQQSHQPNPQQPSFDDIFGL